MDNWSTLAAISMTVAFSAGCSGGGGKADAGGGKEDYEQAIAGLIEPIGLISAYLPYLKQPDDKGEKYAPKRRYDQVKASFHAADEIRHTTNAASQKFKRSKSKVLIGLSPALIKVTKLCATPDEMPAVEKCEAEVMAFAKLLEGLAKEAKAAGVTKPFPLIGPAAVTETAKKKIAPYQEALGPGKLELVHWATLKNEKATTTDVIADCKVAAGAADAVWRAFEKADPEVRKLAAIHKLAVEAQCNQIQITDGILMGVRACKEEKKPEDKPECKLVCANAKTRLGMGVPAAAFATLEKEHEELCLRDATD